VSHGQVDLSAPGSDTVSVSKGRTASFDLFNQDNYDVAHEYEEGPYDSWNEDLDSYHAHNFRHTTGEMPYGYGSSDLNYYGSYISDPGFGSCWRPYFAGYGWDPFADGTWVWYPGFGYTWVSSYPWGWAPYRYGSWNFAQSAGWCWQPGLWTQWVPVPRFGRPPLGWKPTLPPTGGRGRVPRIHEGPVAGSPEPRLGDPTRRILREGTDGSTVLPTQRARGEAGLGVPRGRINLGSLAAPPTPGSRGLIDAQIDDQRHAGSRGLGTSSTSGSGRSSAPPSAPRTSAPRPAPAPRMSPPPAPRPAPVPRGGKGL
jgi:hypothetical protein